VTFRRLAAPAPVRANGAPLAASRARALADDDGADAAPAVAAPPDGGAGAAAPSQAPLGAPPAKPSAPQTPTAAPRPPATEALARRAGALVNELDFPAFVSQLVHGTFDAVVDASIRQMESYASLVSAVAKTVDQFTEENVTPNQARDWLAQRYPGDVVVVLPTQDQPQPQLAPRSEGLTPAWLAEYGQEGQELTADLLESSVVPQVRNKIGGERQQLLATMVLLGMNRVVVKDGLISAKVIFRAAAQDSTKVGYATGSDPQAIGTWGERGSLTYSGGAQTMVSTLSVNAQNDTSLQTNLFGEVKLNFASETLPLDRLADAAKIALVQRNAPNVRPPGTAAPGAIPPPPAPAPTPPPAAEPAHQGAR
jgi:hypothetical protein